MSRAAHKWMVIGVGMSIVAAGEGAFMLLML